MFDDYFGNSSVKTFVGAAVVFLSPSALFLLVLSERGLSVVDGFGAGKVFGGGAKFVDRLAAEICPFPISTGSKANLLSCFILASSSS